MRRAGALLAGLALMGGVAIAAVFPYRVMHRIVLPGSLPVRALAFGPSAKRVYAAAGAEVRAYDLSGRAAGSVKLPGTVTGLASGTGDTLYAVVHAPARLVMLDTRPLHVRASVPLRAGAPSAVLYDRIGDALYVESRSAHTVTRLEPATGLSVGAVRLRGALRQMAANGRGTLYVANAARHVLDVVNATNMTFSGEIPLARCRAPSGLAMDTIGRRLFVACANGRALIVDADLGFTFVRLPIEPGESLRAVFAFHPLGPGGWKGGAFMAGEGAHLDAIRMSAFVRYANGGKLPLAAPCTAMALSPAAGELWLALAPGSGGGSGELLALGETDGGGAP